MQVVQSDIHPIPKSDNLHIYHPKTKPSPSSPSIHSPATNKNMSSTPPPPGSLLESEPVYIQARKLGHRIGFGPKIGFVLVTSAPQTRLQRSMSESYTQKRRYQRVGKSSASNIVEGRGVGGDVDGRGAGEGNEVCSRTAPASTSETRGEEIETIAGPTDCGGGKSNASNRIEGIGAGWSMPSNDISEEHQARVLKPRPVQRRSRTAPPSSYRKWGGENEAEPRKPECSGRKSSASRDVEGGTAEGNTQSDDVAEEARTPILKPRPVRIRSQRAGSMLSSASSSQRRQRTATEPMTGGRKLCAKESRDRNCEKGPEKKREPQMRMSVHEAGCLIRGAAPSLGDSEGVIDRNMKLNAEPMIESGREDKSEVRDGYAIVNGVYHQMSKPGASLLGRPRPKKLQKPQKFKKGARRGCWPWWHGGGDPKCIIG